MVTVRQADGGRRAHGARQPQVAQAEDDHRCDSRVGRGTWRDSHGWACGTPGALTWALRRARTRDGQITVFTRS